MLRMRFMMTPSWLGRAPAAQSRLVPLLAAAAMSTTRDRSQDCPQESARRALPVIARTLGRGSCGGRAWSCCHRRWPSVPAGQCSG